MLLPKTGRLWICKNNRTLPKKKGGGWDSYFCCSRSILTRIQLGFWVTLTKNIENILKCLMWEKPVSFVNEICRIIPVVNGKPWNTIRGHGRYPGASLLVMVLGSWKLCRQDCRCGNIHLYTHCHVYAMRMIMCLDPHLLESILFLKVTLSMLILYYL